LENLGMNEHRASCLQNEPSVFMTLSTLKMH
jgi:hypothetical protein